MVALKGHREKSAIKFTTSPILSPIFHDEIHEIHDIVNFVVKKLAMKFTTSSISSRIIGDKIHDEIHAWLVSSPITP